MVGRWKYVLAQSKDLKNQGELTQARSRTLGLSLNASGNASFRMPMDADLADKIWPIKSALKTYRVGSTGVKLPWSGYVNTIDEDHTANMMTVNCVGWINRLAGRILHQALVQNGIDDGSIIQALLASADATSTEHAGGVTSTTLPDGVTIHWPTGSVPNTPSWIRWGGKLPNEGVGGATAYVPANRSFNFPIYQTNILRAIQSMIEIENGCDISVHPETRELFVYRKRMKTTKAVIGFKWGPENAKQFGRLLDGSTTVNYHMTAGAAGTAPQSATDVASMQEYGPIEEYATLADVTGTNANAVLAAYSGIAVTLGAQPKNLFSFTPFQWTSENSSPEPFVEYDIGDRLTLVAKNPPRMPAVKVQVRLFGMSLDINEEDNENLGQLQVTPN